MKQTLNFTKKELEKLSATNQIITYHDTKTRGLKFVVRPSGTKQFIFYRKIDNKPTRITIGYFPDMHIEVARNKAHQFNIAIANGENPAIKRKNLQNELTLKELFNRYIEEYAKLHKITWQKDIERYRCHLTCWNNKKLSQITKTDVQKWHSTIGKKCGIYTANRTLEQLRSMFNKARLWGWENPNPTEGIKKFKEKSRERFLQAHELPKFFQELDKESNKDFKDYVLISLFTGARQSNVLTMRWDNINFQDKTWNIPRTKNDDSHTIPLSDPVFEILQYRYKILKKFKTPWVFPGTGKAGYMGAPRKSWKNFLQQANIEDLQMHDLRRSLGSWQAVTGASLPVIGKTLAHRSVNTTAVYARLNLDPVRDAINKATMAILGAANS